MCGIWGFSSNDKSLTVSDCQAVVKKLFLLSVSRGKEAAGIAGVTADKASIFKRAVPAAEMIHQRAYQEWIEKFLKAKADGTFALIGHSRLATNGSVQIGDNNQPVICKNVICVHNGIIVNVDKLWGDHSELTRCSEVDSEVFAALLSDYVAKESAGEAENSSAVISQAVKNVYTEIKGMASTLSILADRKILVAATNNGSLYQCISEDGQSVLFASERITLRRVISDVPAARKRFQPEMICQLHAGDESIWVLAPGKDEVTRLSDEIDIDTDSHIQAGAMRNSLVFDVKKYEAFDIDVEPIKKLRRCTRCVLPETMPFIEFDEQGVCNYCKTYKKQEYKGKDALYAWAERLRRTDGKGDSIVSFSGGRDSSYGLHYFVKELGLHPVAFSYDWGMVTDLARRNQSRMCSQLGVELILVSADIHKKRKNIRNNVSAWLKKPDLGMVPLFMAGDKQYFWFANQIRKEYGLDTVLMASNPFEKTHFKSGFCGSKPSVLSHSDKNLELEQLKASGVLRMAAHYMRQYLGNPRYINSSLLDTITATASYYMIPHNYFRLFNYIPWQEDEVNRVLLNQYDWEVSPDSKSTWRIGDGTAPFYNYIYYAVAGFTENDTMRSNQIREGMITREEALHMIYQDNQPRFESMQWYFDVIGLDMAQTLRVVQGMKKLYPTK